MATAPYSPAALLQMHLETLYQCDADGRLRQVNEPERPSAPRLYMGRSPEGNVWRFRYDLPDAVVDDLERLCRAEPVDAGLPRAPHNDAAIQAALNRHAPIEREYSGPAYVIPPTAAAPAHVVRITAANASLLHAGFAWMLPLPQEDNPGPIVAAMVGDTAVAVCFCSRIPGRATEAGVETLAAYRGRGFATAAVAGWAAAVRERGVTPLYSTTWDNRASQGVARKLRMVRYGADWWVD